MKINYELGMISYSLETNCMLLQERKLFVPVAGQYQSRLIIIYDLLFFPDCGQAQQA